MTTLNTIIEEEKKKFEKLEYIIGDINGYEPDGEINTLCSQAQQEVNKLKELRATAMQRVAKTERVHWLRSEIKKLEEEILETELHYDMRGMYETKIHCSALTSIITRYKEELLELDKGV